MGNLTLGNLTLGLDFKFVENCAEKNLLKSVLESVLEPPTTILLSRYCKE